MVLADSRLKSVSNHEKHRKPKSENNHYTLETDHKTLDSRDLHVEQFSQCSPSEDLGCDASYVADNGTVPSVVQDMVSNIDLIPYGDLFTATIGVFSKNALFTTNNIESSDDDILGCVDNTRSFQFDAEKWGEESDQMRQSTKKHSAATVMQSQARRQNIFDEKNSNAQQTACARSGSKLLKEYNSSLIGTYLRGNGSIKSLDEYLSYALKRYQNEIDRLVELAETQVDAEIALGRSKYIMEQTFQNFFCETGSSKYDALLSALLGNASQLTVEDQVVRQRLSAEYRHLVDVSLGFQHRQNSLMHSVIMKVLGLSSQRQKSSESLTELYKVVYSGMLTNHIILNLADDSKRLLKIPGIEKFQLESMAVRNSQTNYETLYKICGILYESCPTLISSKPSEFKALVIYFSELYNRRARFGNTLSRGNENLDHVAMRADNSYKTLKTGSARDDTRSVQASDSLSSFRRLPNAPVAYLFCGARPKMDAGSYLRLTRGTFRMGMYQAYLKCAYDINCGVPQPTQSEVQRIKQIIYDDFNLSERKRYNAQPNTLLGAWSVNFPSECKLRSILLADSTKNSVSVFDDVPSLTLMDNCDIALFEYSYDSPIIVLAGLAGKLINYFYGFNEMTQRFSFNSSASQAQEVPDANSMGVVSLNSFPKNLSANATVQPVNPPILQQLIQRENTPLNQTKARSAKYSEQLFRGLPMTANFGDFGQVRNMKNNLVPPLLESQIRLSAKHGVSVLRTAAGSTLVAAQPHSVNTQYTTPEQYLAYRAELLSRYQYGMKPSRQGFGDFLTLYDHRQTDFLLVRSGSFSQENPNVTVCLRPLHMDISASGSIPQSPLYLLGQLEPIVEVYAPEGKKATECLKLWLEAYCLRLALNGVAQSQRNRKIASHFFARCFDNSVIQRVLFALRQSKTAESVINHASALQPANKLGPTIKIASENSILRIISLQSVISLVSSQWYALRLKARGICSLKSLHQLAVVRQIMQVRDWVSDIQWFRMYAMWTEYRKRLAALKIKYKASKSDFALFSLPYPYRSLDVMCSVKRSLVVRYIEELLYYSPWQIYRAYSEVRNRKHAQFLSDSSFEYSIGRGQHLCFWRSDIGLMVTRESGFRCLNKGFSHYLSVRESVNMSFDPTKFVCYELITRSHADNTPSDEIQEVLIRAGLPINYVAGLSRGELVTLFCEYASCLVPRSQLYPLRFHHGNKLNGLRHNVEYFQMQFIAGTFPVATQRDLACLFYDFENNVEDKLKDDANDLERLVFGTSGEQSDENAEISSDCVELPQSVPIESESVSPSSNSGQVVDPGIDGYQMSVGGPVSDVPVEKKAGSVDLNVDNSVDSRAVTEKINDKTLGNVEKQRSLKKQLWCVQRTLSASAKVGNSPKYQKVAWNASVKFNEQLEFYTSKYADSVKNSSATPLVFPFSSTAAADHIVHWLNMLDDPNLIDVLAKEITNCTPVLRWIRKDPTPSAKSRVILILGSQLIFDFLKWRKQAVEAKLESELEQFTSPLFANLNRESMQSSDPVPARRSKAPSSGGEASKTGNESPTYRLAGELSTKSGIKRSSSKLQYGDPDKADSSKYNKKIMIRQLRQNHDGSCASAIQKINETLYYLIQPVLRTKKFSPFIQRVSTDIAPGYYTRIKNPMWVLMILDKTLNREYRSLNQCMDDFRLLKDNCFLYNPPGHWLRHLALDLIAFVENEASFELEWIAKLESDLRAHGAYEENAPSAELSANQVESNQPVINLPDTGRETG